MPSFQRFGENVGLAEELQAELSKSLLGVKAAGRRARNKLIKMQIPDKPLGRCLDLSD